MKYVYSFKEGNKDMREILGGKGANLAEMTNLGLPVPQGFTVSTEACNDYYENNLKISDEITIQIFEKLEELERITEKKFGDKENPLLVSVRSGARASMPGMMDTILNLGMNSEVCESLAIKTNNRRFALDSYRRLIQMYSDVVMNLPKGSFEGLFDEYKKEVGKELDTDLNSQDLEEVIRRYKREYLKLVGKEFPEDPREQLIEAVKAVFRSWNTDRAKTYRKLNDIPEEWGTAVNVQSMVYGNTGDNSGTGVCFTRNPSTGENELFGEFLINAQGEDVVAGIRTPESIDKLKEIMPECYEEFKRVCEILEKHYKDMQDMEFTIENRKLYMLQTRNGKRTTKAAIKIAVDQVREGLITRNEALLRIEPKDLDQLLHPIFDEKDLKAKEVVAHGLAASPGAACGKLYFSKEDVLKAHDNGEKDIILVREETSPEDIEGMNVARGILTVRGGMTSHAAVVARGMGTTCVSGCSSIVVDISNKTIKTLDGKILREGEYISLDGSTGNVYFDKINMLEAEISGDFEEFMRWADDVRRLEVRVNADTPRDAKVARKFGAQGIGLCRTEHMFFDEARIFNFRRMIIAPTLEKREEALSKILPYQREDFEGLFTEMNNLPVIIRFLDPPLHEFLPKKDSEIRMLAESLGEDFNFIKEKVDSLKEFNPMMGHRGCRLAITYPEIARMQTRAVLEAAINVKKKGLNPVPEIMIPLVGDAKEFVFVKTIVDLEAKKVFEENNMTIDYKVGTMIEIPRACVESDKIASVAEFFSYGTNDLTQLTYGFSRDDASKFLKDYYDKKVFDNDPFQSIDRDGVGKLMSLSSILARSVRSDISLGICGEHGGDKNSIEFCHNIGLDYVSCSPYRVPIARLAAAQAAIKAKNNK
ncbi:MAG: pyruvate, phosphate dikinase [Bacilli bacterium]|nr:pyruvate, phosphate dikinase [Bacilli bacterium]